MSAGPPLRLIQDQEGAALTLTRSRLSLGAWSHLSFADGSFTARFTGWVFFGGKSLSVSFRDITSIELSCSDEVGGPLSLCLWVSYRAGGKDVTCELPFSVEALDLRAEALDLFCRIAKIVGVEHYEAHSTNQWSSQLSADDDPFRGAALRKIPERLGAARYTERSYQPPDAPPPTPAKPSPRTTLQRPLDPTRRRSYLAPPPRGVSPPNPSAKRDERRTWLQRELINPSQRRPSGLNGPRGRGR